MSRITLTLTLATTWEDESLTPSELRDQALALTSEYISSPDGPFHDDYSADGSYSKDSGWAGPFLVSAHISRAQPARHG
jgi:hypothetical protein